VSEAEETYTVQEAARILRTTERTMRRRLERGYLEGTRDPTTGRWTVAARSVTAAMPRRPPKASQEPSESPESVQEYRDRVGRNPTPRVGALRRPPRDNGGCREHPEGAAATQPRTCGTARGGIKRRPPAVVAAYLRTVTVRCPSIRDFREHYLFVVTDELRTPSAISAVSSGHCPQAHRPLSYMRLPKKPTPGALTIIVLSIHT
jgi:hypothetical protein